MEEESSKTIRTEKDLVSEAWKVVKESAIGSSVNRVRFKLKDDGIDGSIEGESIRLYLTKDERVTVFDRLYVDIHLHHLSRRSKRECYFLIEGLALDDGKLCILYNGSITVPYVGIDFWDSSSFDCTDLEAVQKFTREVLDAIRFVCHEFGPSPIDRLGEVFL